MDTNAIETSLETHLQETRQALEDINQLLQNEEDESHSELLKLKEELERSVQESESALIQLKKERLLGEHAVTPRKFYHESPNCLGIGKRRERIFRNLHFQ